MRDPIEMAQVGQASIQKATGPRSKAGKEKSSRSAIKHGIFSEVVVLPGEPREKYQSLLKGLQEAWQPGDETEKHLVEKLASIAWRYRRFLSAEGAEIRHGSEFVEWDQQNGERQKAETNVNNMENLFDSDPGLIRSIHVPDMLDGCLELLCELREEIESSGFDKDRDAGGPGGDLRLGHNPEQDTSSEVSRVAGYC
jgi:hypothetical protein